MIEQLETNISCNGVESMIDQIRILPFGGAIGAVEIVFGIRHVVEGVCGFQAAFVECLVVCHEGQMIHFARNHLPHFGEGGRIDGVMLSEAMHLGVPMGVKVWIGAHQMIEGVGDNSVFDNDFIVCSILVAAVRITGV